MACDLCKKPMVEDEEGMFLLEAHLGGHITCIRLYINENEMELT